MTAPALLRKLAGFGLAHREGELLLGWLVGADVHQDRPRFAARHLLIADDVPTVSAGVAIEATVRLDAQDGPGIPGAARRDVHSARAAVTRVGDVQSDHEFLA